MSTWDIKTEHGRGSGGMYKVCTTCHKDLHPNVGYVLSNYAGKVHAHHKECLPTPAPSKPKVWKYLYGYVDAD